MGVSPRKALLRAVVWVVVSLVFLDIGWERIVDLRAAERYIHPLRYANVGFWVVVLAFWGWNAWRSFRAMRQTAA